MAKKMLIDATHPEETRVVVAEGTKVEEFDFESLNKRQLAGNIYLAKVTRVEPSLQAAFVEYGGNRHGFLAFPEIHPDYYQIPKADRDAILAEERAMAEAQAAEEGAADVVEAEGAEAEGAEDVPKKSRSRSRTRSRGRRKAEDGAEASEEGDATSEEAAAADAGEDEAVETAEAEEARPQDDASGPDSSGQDSVTSIAESAGLEDEEVSADAQTAEPAGMETVDLGNAVDVANRSGSEAEAEGGDAEEAAPKPSRSRSRSRARSKKAEATERGETEAPAGTEDEVDEDVRPPRPQRSRARKYKIQEVVKVRQIMLVQVVKEERGNKGAALTTYLSLAGRYCVLMPNTARGGGISRKITNVADRKKLKEIAGEIDVPQGAGLIIRTAGAKRTKTEIKRDYEYLQRQWEQVRELTLKSIAPAPIYEEGDLINRAIRDYYTRDIDEVIVDGEAGYRQAKDYMKLIMPSHAKNVTRHEGPQPLFAKHGVETYLSSMFNPTVQLKSGGYIVIGITEALVAVDVNSGKATKEGSIEETALKTNLEAADEVARQAKLRDLAGLIVIDFIDMDERKNNAAVEKQMKDALKNDRARIQIGRISSFGLMEMSRQRLRPGMLEATTQPCAHCHGTGLIRSDDSIALQVLRSLEEEGGRRRSREVLARLPVKVANYLMNEKREHLAAIEQRYEMAVRVEADPALIGDELTALEKFKTTSRVIPKPAEVVGTDTSWVSEDEDEDEVVEADEVEEAPAREARAPEGRADGDEGAPTKKRRRRSRRKKGGGGDGETPDVSAEAVTDGAEVPADVGPAGEADTQPAEEVAKPKSRTRRRSRKSAQAPAEDAPSGVAEAQATEVSEPEAVASDTPAAVEPEPEDAPEAAEAQPETAEAQPEAAAPKRKSRVRAKAPAPVEAALETVTDAVETVSEAVGLRGEKAEAEPPAHEPEAESEAEPARTEKPKRRGWWSFGG